MEENVMAVISMNFSIQLDYFTFLKVYMHYM